MGSLITGFTVLWQNTNFSVTSANHICVIAIGTCSSINVPAFSVSEEQCLQQIAIDEQFGADYITSKEQEKEKKK